VIVANLLLGGSTATCNGVNMDKWECPKSWTSGGSAPHDAKDAKAFVALHNIFRCMHDVQAVQWDSDVHSGAKKWAEHTGESMTHSQGGTGYRKKGDGENLAGTFKFSKHPGVDATHMWYEEIWNPCGWKKSCYQSFSAGHMTAMIWKSINKIAYSDTTGKLAVGRYRDCLGNGPNMMGEYKKMVPPQKYNWASCANKVLNQCSAFSGVHKDDVEGCGKQSAAWSKNGMHMVYPQKCSKLYDRGGTASGGTASGGTGKPATKYSYVKGSVECKSDDHWLGKGFTVESCASAVEAAGGKFFIFGKGSGFQKGRCYVEKSSGPDCPEGYEKDEYNFYKLTSSRLRLNIETNIESNIISGDQHFSAVGVGSLAVAGVAFVAMGVVVRRKTRGSYVAPENNSDEELLESSLE